MKTLFLSKDVPVGKDEFVWEPGVLKFQRGDDGAVSGFALHPGPIRDIGFTRTAGKKLR